MLKKKTLQAVELYTEILNYSTSLYTFFFRVYHFQFHMCVYIYTLCMVLTHSLNGQGYVFQIVLFKE
jgi:hypothetical protein